MNSQGVRGGGTETTLKRTNIVAGDMNNLVRKDKNWETLSCTTASSLAKAIADREVVGSCPEAAIALKVAQRWPVLSLRDLYTRMKIN